jgi:hypothetical protein
VRVDVVAESSFDAVDGPMAFSAFTVNQYFVALANPVTVYVVPVTKVELDGVADSPDDVRPTKTL